MMAVRRGSIFALGVALVLLAPAAIGASSPTVPNQQAAQAAASQMLAALQLPTGATEVTTDPSQSSALGSPATSMATPALVDDHAFWRVPGTPASVLSWIQANPPAGAKRDESSGGEGTPSWVGFRFPPRSGVLSSRELVIEVASATGGGTALRADAQVVWVVVRSATERIPRAIREITITARRLGKSSSPPVTVSAAGMVRRIVAYVNKLQVAQPGAFHCPADFGPDVKLVFRKLPKATPVAIATADGSGCGSVTLSISGEQEPALTGGPQLIKWLSSLLHTSFS